MTTQVPVQNGAEKSNFTLNPDYGKMMEFGTNSAIVSAFIQMLFSSKNKFSFPMVFVMIRNMAVLLLVKTCLEDSKAFLDKFKLTNLNSLKFYWQRMMHKHLTYTIQHQSNGKWMYENTPISMTLLTPFFEQKQILIGRPDNYYYSHRTCLLKISITNERINITFPDIQSVVQHVNNDIIHRNREIICGDRTVMYKVSIGNGAVPNLDPVSISKAYGTDIYLKLEHSIRNYFFVDIVMQFQSIPFCINFNGEPGTGKTTFGSYIANKGIFDRIIIYNLVQSTNFDFKDNLNKIEMKIDQSTNKLKPMDGSEKVLIIFDEIDKWLESYIENKIHKMRDEARVTKQSNGGSAGGDKNTGTIIEGFQKLTPEEEQEKKNQLRFTFLDQLYNVVDGHTLKNNKKYVIIFNTNHFDNMFDNSPERFNALKDRFQKYEFKKLRKREIINYLSYVNECFKNYELTENDKNILLSDTFDVDNLCVINTDIYNGIPDDMIVSFRNLQKILRANHFNINRVVEHLSQIESSEIFTSDDIMS
ncbi:P-loop NTPase family protein [Niemeyer virus]|uniref:ATPase AAA-type core domain-containing protein n=1 Tax=Acanthamoeba polyphaga mimivirus Kroon TaxID=3069720 RepID=A0A0G2Y9B8_9VIRU|nr:hypothetical protein QJ850_gp247 [Acanthamoeba polyphaga mimivirus]AKI80452.1 hypothetical protein [Acanthamoeba polyphaga mimivirus Kroon]ALR84421.1 P-loop NTPase family protein [Niemeyer virus]